MALSFSTDMAFTGDTFLNLPTKETVTAAWTNTFRNEFDVKFAVRAR